MNKEKKIKKAITIVAYNNPVNEGMLFGVGFTLAFFIMWVFWEILKAFLIAFYII